MPTLSGTVIKATPIEDASRITREWHDGIHKWICGDFAKPTLSGLDPLFYAFHSYVDRILESSTVQAVKRGINLGEEWAIFYNPYQDEQGSTDVNKGWVYVNLQRFVDPGQWGYTYDEPIDPATLDNSPAITFRDIPLPASEAAEFNLVARRKSATPGSDEEVLTRFRPFGHAHSSYDFVRVPLSQDRVNELLSGRWEFLVRSPVAGSPSTIPPDHVKSEK